MPDSVGTIVIACPVDGYFITEIRGDFGRGICKLCGAEITYRSKKDRHQGSVTHPEQGIESLERTVTTR